MKALYLLGKVSFVLIVLISGFANYIHAQTVVIDPYKEVNWESFQQCKANLHTHTTQSDGKLSPDQVIGEYHSRGYKILALTDHDLCTWPWTKYMEENAIEALGILPIAGNEYSNHHHANGLYVQHETKSTNLEQTIKEVDELGGLIQINHPGRYWKPVADGSASPEIIEYYADIYKKYDNVLGMEIINQGNRYKDDIRLWDALLTALLPDRPIWAFCNDDMHKASHLGRDWNVILVSALDADEVKSALESGQFYCSTVSTHPEETRNVGETPTIISISHDPDLGTLTIHAVSGGEDVPDYLYAWISDGKLVHRGPSIDYRNTEGLGLYVRAEITGKGGTSFTNPFVIQK
jgi:hypothetical protein